MRGRSPKNRQQRKPEKPSHRKSDRPDRLFPSQDLLPTGGVGNLIAAPLFRPARQNGRTLFLDLATLEPHKDQWAHLSSLGRMSPQELRRAADRAGKVAVATEVTRLVTASSTATRPPAAAVLRARRPAGPAWPTEGRHCHSIGGAWPANAGHAGAFVPS